jgi:hypothetical protein
VLTGAGMTCVIVTLIIESLFRVIKPSAKVAAPAN